MAERPRTPPPQNSFRLLWGRLTISFIITALLFGSSYWVQQIYYALSWPVSSVTINGQLKHLTRTELEERLTPLLAVGFLHLNLDQLQQALVAMPWVDKVSIRRIWPHKLSINLQEQQPLAIWNGNAVMNQRGELFYPVDMESARQGLAELSGPTEALQKSAELYRSLHKLATAARVTIRRLSLDERRALQLELSSGLLLKVGRSEQLARVERFFRIYRLGFEPYLERIAWIDLRYTNGLAIRWREPPSAKVG